MKCQEYTQLRQKLCPEWSPQDATPYDVQLPCRYELHHVHPGAGKSELQAVINESKWKALVLRQKRPMQWLVSAEGPPDRDTILTQHGCILIVQSTDADRPASKGRGKGKKGNKQVVVGGHAIPPRSTHPVASPQHPDCFPAIGGEGPGPTATHAMLEKDVQNMRAEFADHVQSRRKENAAIQERIAGVETALGAQLTSFMTGLTSTLQQQKQELASQLQSGQDSLRQELTHEMRNQLSTIRKRTPSPTEERAEDKRARG